MAGLYVIMDNLLKDEDDGSNLRETLGNYMSENSYLKSQVEKYQRMYELEKRASFQKEIPKNDERGVTSLEIENSKLRSQVEKYQCNYELEKKARNLDLRRIKAADRNDRKRIQELQDEVQLQYDKFCKELDISQEKDIEIRNLQELISNLETQIYLRENELLQIKSDRAN